MNTKYNAYNNRQSSKQPCVELRWLRNIFSTLCGAVLRFIDDFIRSHRTHIASLFCVLFFHQLYIYEKLLTIDECEFICTRSRTVVHQHMLNNIMNMTNTDISCVCVYVHKYICLCEFGGYSL